MKYVYLIKSEVESVYKIGVSINPKRRLRQLNTGNQDKLILIDSFPSEFPYKVEKSLQSGWSHLKSHGEWFNLYLEDELKFKNLCEKIEKNLKFLKENKI